MYAAGVAGGWNGPTIPILVADDSPIPMTMAQGSWLITVAVYGLLATAYPTVWLARRLGPQRTLLLAAAPFLLGWLLIALATDVATLFIARLSFGCAYGVCYTLMPVYLSEIASVRVRGSLLAMPTVMTKSGFLFCFALAPFLAIRTMAVVSMVPCALFAATFVWMPDSPYHLVAVGRRDEAQRCLQRLRGHDDVAAETDAIEVAVREAAGRQRGTFGELLAPAQRRALIIAVGSALILPLCGSTAITDYSQLIFAKINWRLSAVAASILLATVQLVSAVLGNAAIDVVGRRPLLLGSSATMAVCTAVVGAYFGAERRLNVDVSTIGWLPVAGLMVFQFAFSVGMEPVAATLVGELFPEHLKPLASAVCLVVNTCADVTVGKLFQVASDGWGSDFAFAALAMFAGAYLVFAMVAVPETKGRRLGDILADLRKGRD